MPVEPPQSSSDNRAATNRGAESADALKVHDQAAAIVPTYGVITVLAFALWGVAIAVGSGYGVWYETNPVATGIVADHWPAESECVLSPDRPTLLMFVHPRCPCSRSSLNELAVLMARCQNRVDAQVLFFKPQSSGPDWAKTDLWERAARIPAVVPRLDLDGTERRRFGAQVSGEVFLFLPNCELSFHGGVTAGRGHFGDNLGRSALESILLNRHSSITRTPVFGCRLAHPVSMQPNHSKSLKLRKFDE